MSKGQTVHESSLQKLGDHGRKMRQFELDDLKDVLSTESGRAFYYRVIYELASIEGDVFDPSVRDGACSGQHMAYRDGRRSIGITMKTEAKRHFPHLWGELHAERNARAVADAMARENIKQPAGDSNHE